MKGFCHVVFVLNVVTEFSSSSSLALCFVSQGFFVWGCFLFRESGREILCATSRSRRSCAFGGVASQMI